MLSISPAVFSREAEHHDDIKLTRSFASALKMELLKTSMILHSWGLNSILYVVALYSQYAAVGALISLIGVVTPAACCTRRDWTIMLMQLSRP